MGLLYRTLPYKHLYKWLSQEACLDQKAPFFDHTILLDTEEPERDYDEKCQSLQDQVAEEWRDCGITHWVQLVACSNETKQPRHGSGRC